MKLLDTQLHTNTLYLACNLLLKPTIFFLTKTPTLSTLLSMKALEILSLLPIFMRVIQILYAVCSLLNTCLVWLHHTCRGATVEVTTNVLNS